MAERRRRIFLRVLAIVVGVGVLLTVLGFGLFRSDPRWYRHVQLTDAEQAAGQQRLLDRLATLRNEVGRSQASPLTSTMPAAPLFFDIEIREDEVNGVLMRWSQADPRVRDVLKSIQEPHVRFLDDEIEFAGRSPDLGTLVSVGMTVTQTDHGPRLELGRPWAGRLPLSRALLERPGEQAVANLRQHPSGVPEETIDALAKLIAGESVAPIIPLPSSLQGGGMMKARVEKLSVADGVLKATLRPIEEPAKTAR